MKKVDQCKGQEEKITKLEQEALEIKSAKEQLQKEFDTQKLAYEAILESVGQASETSKELEELKEKYKELEIENQKLSSLQEEKKEEHRTSITSDGDEYSSVQEMKDHLKHARQILISFLTKLPFSSPENEATLPIIYSMFEFTKEESDKLVQTRLENNTDKMKQEVQDKSKKMFGKLFAKKKGDSARGPNTNGSFNSGGNNTNNSQGTK